MSASLRVFLVVCSLLVLVFMFKKLKKASLEVSDSIFWFALSLVLLVLAVFPQIAYWAAALLGFEAASNFVFLCIIVVLLARSFTQDQHIATLKKKLTTMAQTVALHEADDHNEA